VTASEMKNFCALLIVFAAAAPAAAHLVDILPSTCAVDVQLSVSGTAAVVDPPAPNELLRVVYTPNSSPERSRIQVCSADPADSSRCGPPIPRGFTFGSSQGTLALPTAFNMAMVASGELRADAVPVAMTIDASPATVPFDLTTELVVGADEIAVGQPIGSTGAVTLMGSGQSSTLPAPFTNAALLLRLACVLAPAPDLDQFALASHIKAAKGAVTGKRTKLTVTVDPEGNAADFAAPAIVRLAQGDTVVAVAMLPAGLAQSGRRYTADYATGSLVVVQKKRGHKVILKDNAGFAGPFATADGEIAIEVGGLFARVPVGFRANRPGTRMAVKVR
jgi:hypothetical protein